MKDLITKIIDNITFISYNTSFLSFKLKNTFKIYEKGLFNKQINKKPIALLKFYAFIIVINIHEIGDHINDRLQYYYFPKNSQQSPNINYYFKDKCSKRGTLRGKEYRETVDILLFGKVLKLLTVKESLYVLNIENYSQTLENFKNNFQQCENKTIDELLSYNSLKSLLNNLDIMPDEITEKDNIKYGDMASIQMYDDNESSLGLVSKHPFGFYLEDSKDILEKIYNHYKNKAD